MFWDYLLHLILRMIFQKKISPTLYSIKRPNFILCLLLLLEILGNMCIVTLCYPVCDAINVEINLSFLIKTFSYMTAKGRRKT